MQPLANPARGRTDDVIRRAGLSSSGLARQGQLHDLPIGSAASGVRHHERRSNAVMKYLAGLGVGSAQLSETSRGSLDASGSDEAAWRQDRRVDIDLLGAKP